MGEPAQTEVEIKDWLGLVTRVDPHDIPPGAAREQVNVTSQKLGRLALRPGYRKVQFDD